MEELPVVVVGAGQAGLSLSYHLRQLGVEHVVLDKAARPGDSWRRRGWDSFRLVTPRWLCRLPGEVGEVAADPGAFDTQRETAARIERLAAVAQAPIRAPVAVHRLSPDAAAGGFLLQTSAGPLRARTAVVATGTFHLPRLPACASRLDGATVQQLHSSAYRSPEQLPPGGVLVVGSGQSGWQIARELHLAGRPVHWSLGRASRWPRRYRGRDIFRWISALGLLDLPLDEHPAGSQIRREPKPFFGDHRGPAEPEDPRLLAREGLVLHGRLEAVAAARVRFRDDLTANLRDTDDACLAIADLIDTFIARQGLAAPPRSPLSTDFAPALASRDLDLRREGIGSVIWATGYQSDWQRWLAADVFDELGCPRQARGVSPIPDLYFVGLDWLHTWGSGLLYGVGQDAAYLAEHIAGRHRG